MFVWLPVVRRILRLAAAGIITMGIAFHLALTTMLVVLMGVQVVRLALTTMALMLGVMHQLKPVITLTVTRACRTGMQVPRCIVIVMLIVL